MQKRRKGMGESAHTLTLRVLGQITWETGAVAKLSRTSRRERVCGAGCASSTLKVSRGRTHNQLARISTPEAHTSVLTAEDHRIGGKVTSVASVSAGGASEGLGPCGVGIRPSGAVDSFTKEEKEEEEKKGKKMKPQK